MQKEEGDYNGEADGAYVIILLRKSSKQGSQDGSMICVNPVESVFIDTICLKDNRKYKLDMLNGVVIFLRV